MAKNTGLGGLTRQGWVFGGLLAAVASAGTGAQQATSQQWTMTANGPRSTTAIGAVPTPATSTGPGTLPILSNGCVWSHTSGVEGWTPRVVSIGGTGTQVFTALGPYADYSRVFSSFDQDPPLPIVQQTSTVVTLRHRTSSADATDVHVAAFDVPCATPGLRQLVVKAFSPTIPAANWTYNWPALTNTHDRFVVRATRDGSRFVVASLNHTNFALDVATFSSTSATPLTTRSIPNAGAFTGLDISADGTKLAVLAGVRFEIHDLVAGQMLYSQLPFVPLYQAVALSGDGTYAAYGSDGQVRIFRRSATTGQYSLVLTHTLAGPNYCDRLDISDDGSTLAMGFNFTDTFRRVVLQTIDLPTLTVLMTDSIVGQGAWQNTVSDICLSANGRRVALGEWGDQFGAAPELRIYERDSAVPIRSVDLPGSVIDVDLSADGRRVAVAAKGVHANVTGGGGTIQLFEATSLDVTVTGVPHAGGQVTVELRGQPGKPALLLVSPTLAATPSVLGVIGTLWLSRTGLNVLSAGTFDGLGRATVTVNVPTTVGASSYLQGYSNSPRRLSRDWVRLTSVP
ncbi:MAG: hypothetical protein IPJ77_13310 [Planctomycetes bacterium]|nr:hypothetical protein [Planctomycetota bacterium]